MTMSGMEVVKLLQRNGFTIDRICGSHYILKRDSTTISVPVHGSRALKQGLLNAILKQAGLK